MEAVQDRPKFDVRDEIRAAISRGQSDPYKIARSLAKTVPPEIAQEFIELRIVELCRSIMSDNRTGSFIENVDDPTAPGVALNSDRWRNGVVHVPGNGFVRYSELTATDCTAIADEREAMANGHMAEAKRFRALAAAITKYKVANAGMLTESVRAEILK